MLLPSRYIQTFTVELDGPKKEILAGLHRFINAKLKNQKFHANAFTNAVNLRFGKVKETESFSIDESTFKAIKVYNFFDPLGGQGKISIQLIPRENDLAEAHIEINPMAENVKGAVLLVFAPTVVVCFFTLITSFPKFLLSATIGIATAAFLAHIVLLWNTYKLKKYSEALLGEATILLKTDDA